MANEEKKSDHAADESTGKMSILGQFIKDLSFENFMVFQSAQPQGEQKLNVQVQVSRTPLKDTFHEVVISLVATTSATPGVVDKKSPGFHLEMVYGGVFQLENIKEEEVEPILLIEAPRYLFPFLRQAVATTTQMGGMPPLMLEPIDFRQLYLNKWQEKQASSSVQ